MMENSKNILGLDDAYEIAQSIVGNMRLSASLFVEVVDALRTAEQERDQYKAELQRAAMFALQWQAEENSKHLELESLRAKIKEAQDQKPVAFLSPSGELRSSCEAIDSVEWGAQFTPLVKKI